MISMQTLFNSLVSLLFYNQLLLLRKYTVLFKVGGITRCAQKLQRIPSKFLYVGKMMLFFSVL